MAAAVAEVEEEQGSVGVLVNNAGYLQSGAVESIPLDVIRRQFETNVFRADPDEPTRPAGYAPGRARPDHQSRLHGRTVYLPGGGIYHATKYAVEAISDAMRFEVQGFGVQVVLIEPGLITTEFAHAAVGSTGGLNDGPCGLQLEGGRHHGGDLREPAGRPDRRRARRRRRGDPEGDQSKRPKARYTVTRQRLWPLCNVN